MIKSKNKFIMILVGRFNPSEKYARQIGNLPQVGVKIKHIWNHHLVIYSNSNDTYVVEIGSPNGKSNE